MKKNRWTWNRFAHYFNPSLSEREIYDMLWTWTAFPMGGVVTVAKQLMREIRAHRNKIPRCWECSMIIGHHTAYCRERRGKPCSFEWRMNEKHTCERSAQT